MAKIKNLTEAVNLVRNNVDDHLDHFIAYVGRNEPIYVAKKLSPVDLRREVTDLLYSHNIMDKTLAGRMISRYMLEYNSKQKDDSKELNNMTKSINKTGSGLETLVAVAKVGMVISAAVFDYQTFKDSYSISDIMVETSSLSLPYLLALAVTNGASLGLIAETFKRKK